MDGLDIRAHEDGAASEVYAVNSRCIQLHGFCIAAVEPPQAIFDPVNLLTYHETQCKRLTLTLTQTISCKALLNHPEHRAAETV